MTSFTPTKSSILTNNTSANMLKSKAAAIIPKKHTPPADIAKKRKRGAVDDIDTIMIESTKNISSLATTLETQMKTSTSNQGLQQSFLSGFTPPVQGMMSSIALGLGKVSEESHIDCLISVLSCIKDFINNKKKTQPES